MTETTHRLKSLRTENERTIWLCGPQDPASPCNLVVFLDGEFYRGDIGARATIDARNGQGRLPNTLFVFVSFVDMATRAREQTASAPFAHFINFELLPWLEALHPGLKNRATRVLVGVSLSALAAMHAVLHVEPRFTHVIAQSGAFWWNDSWLVEQYRRLPAPLSVEFYLDVGTRETEVDEPPARDSFFQAVSQLDVVRQLRAVLQEKGHRVQYLEFQGGHSAKHWRAALPAALGWALSPSKREGHQSAK